MEKRFRLNHPALNRSNMKMHPPMRVKVRMTGEL